MNAFSLKKDFLPPVCNTVFMPEKHKIETITFAPDDDVSKELADLLASMGSPYGLRTKVINDVLRDGLPKWRIQTLAALKNRKAA